MSTARPTPVRAVEPVPMLSVAPELERVEARIREAIRSCEPQLTTIADYLINSGGKRIRPAVTLLAYRASGGPDDRLDDVVDVAVALELIHSASLLHDDIIDASELRRGRDSALRRYGLARTLVAGDFLFGQAYRICARFEERLIHWAVDACILLTEGEIMQGRFRHNPEVTLPDYLEIVRRKTASLFEAGARTASYLAGADENIVEAMATAGRHVGLTFQMIDDVLDVTGEESRLGKPVGIDLRDGNPSLPVVLSLPEDAEVRHLFSTQEPTEGEVSALLARLRRSPALDQARALAADHAARTRESLRELPASAHRDELLSLVDQLIDRVS